MSKVVKVRGADRIERTMHQCAKDLERMDESTATYGELVARTARANAPNRTGRLRASIVVSGEQVLATVRYALPVEFGARGRRAVRFMGRAVQSTEADRDKIYTAGAADAADKIKGA